jgi:hypothetical protein
MILLVAVVALVASTLVTSLGVLVSATERGAVRGALAGAPTQQKEFRTWLTRPTESVDSTQRTVSDAIQTVIGNEASAQSTVLSLSELYITPRKKTLFGMAYFGEIDGVDVNADLTDGRWPVANPSGDVEVALPSSAAKERKLTVGSTITVTAALGKPTFEISVVGIYQAAEPTGRYWSADVLQGAGFDPRYPVPGTQGALATDASGPLIVAHGELDNNALAVERIVVTSNPEFSGATVDGLLPLLDRVSKSNVSVPADLGAVATSISTLSELPNALRGIVSAISATRGTVFVLGLLILILAIAALTQTARLLNSSRAGERALMRARGASGRQILGLAALEAALVVVFAATVSPLLARYVYMALAAQPAMKAAGMAVDPGVPTIAWLISGASAVVLWAVIVAPLLRNDSTFQETQQAGARQRRASGLQRSGVDFAVVVLAGVAYWQLSFSSPAQQSAAQLWVDPIVVAAPALLVIAGAMVSVRLVPLVSRAAEVVIARGRGAVVALAAWEVGRRPQKATAAVLLLTLAISIGTFSQSFLESWRQSQTDQAEFAVGAPVRVDDDGVATLSNLVAAGQLARSGPQPTIRTDGEIAGEEAVRAFGDPPNGKPAVVIGLTSDARKMLNTGRLSTEGGADLLTAIPTFAEEPVGIALDDEAAGISVVMVASAEDKRKDLIMNVRAILEDSAGTMSFTDLGNVYVDGTKYRASGLLPSQPGAKRLVGITAGVTVDPLGPTPKRAVLSTRVTLTVRDFSTVELKPGKDGLDKYDQFSFTEYHATHLDPDLEAWRGSGDLTSLRTGYSPTVIPTIRWPLELRFTVLADLRQTPMNVSAVAWRPATVTPIVVSGPIAEKSHLGLGDHVTLIVDGQLIPALIAGLMDHVPGGGSATTFSALGTVAGSNDESSVIVDANTLMRSFAQAGVKTRTVTEWWVDVAPEDQQNYLTDLEANGLDGTAGAILGTELQQHPLRVAILAALWLVTLGAAILAAIGFAIHATGNVRSRAIEFAQLRAIGLTRTRLVAAVTIESLLLSVMGTIFGVGLGVGLSYLVTPVVGASGSSATTVPEAIVLVPWVNVGVLTAVVGAVLLVLVLVLARTQRAADPASALRWGGER